MDFPPPRLIFAFACGKPVCVHSERLVLKNFPSPEELVLTAAANWLTAVATSPAERSITVALPGGRITRQLLAMMAKLSRSESVPLGRVHWFWGDERCVPPDSEDSNFKLADELLFRPLNLPPANIHRVRGEAEPLAEAGRAAEELRSHADSDGQGQPVIDWVFLGLGEDGHTASLFPEEPEAVSHGSDVYRAVTATKPPPRRITLGYAALAAARNVWVFVSGRGKEQALRTSLAEAGETPLARVIRSRRETIVYTDVPR